jgi:hypothetical protein
MAGSSSAAPVAPATLADLLPGGSFANGYQVGDKLFYGFDYVGTASNAAAIVDANNIAVRWLTDSLNPGVRFISGGWSAGINQWVDSTIFFSVKVVTPGMLIKDVSLLFNGIAQNGGIASVSETVNSSLNMGVFAYNTNSNTTGYGNFTADALITPPTVGPLYIMKDISVYGWAGLASISVVENRFSQTPVPIPSGFLLLGPGLAGLALVRRRMGSKP